jgi:hypothetical protein
MDRPSWVTNEQTWLKDCRRIAARTRDLLEGRLGVIAAAREFAELEFLVRASDDPDFITFNAIRSQADHLPIGPERQHWSASALTREDKEIEAVEDFYRERAFAAARNLLARYSASSNNALNPDAPNDGAPVS